MTETHSHDHHTHPDAHRAPGIPRIGIGGPVGSGKTALIEALVPLLVAGGWRPLVVTNDIFTQEDAKHVRATLAGVLAAERVVGVETGSCPHTAVRDDPSMNLDAIARLERRFPDGDVVLVESGGDNLTLTFSRALADYFVFVIDVAEGDKIPRKRGARRHQLRPAGDQQDGPRAARPRRPAGDGARRAGGARRAALRLHELLHW